MSSSSNPILRNPLPVTEDDTQLASDIAEIRNDLATNQAAITAWGDRSPLAQSESGELVTLDPNLVNIFGSRLLINNDRLRVEPGYRDDLFNFKCIGANSEASIDCSGYSSATIQLSGTWTGTITFEATSDGGNWASIIGLSMSSSAGATTTTGNGIFRFNVAGLARLRARFSTYTSGLAIVSFRLSSGPGGTFLIAPVSAQGSQAVALSQKASSYELNTFDTNLAAVLGALNLQAPITRPTTIAPAAQPTQTTYISNFLASFPQIQPRLGVEIGASEKLPIAQNPNTLELKVIDEQVERLLENILVQLMLLNKSFLQV